MADKAWKAFERRVASFFGTLRNSLSGGNSKLTRSDSLHSELFIECKHSGKGFAHHGIVKDAKTKAIKEEKTAVVCTQGKHEKTFYVTVDKDDLVPFCKAVLRSVGFSIFKKKRK